MNSQYVVANYSYHETKEAIAGYDVVLAWNLNEVVSIAKTCPLLIKSIVPNGHTGFGHQGCPAIDIIKKPPSIEGGFKI
jgi:hypothetical protein